MQSSMERMILFAALVKQNRDRAWKSYRHEDGELCFGGGWFIVGIDTPEGSYTYHYENKDFELFDCEELPVGKHWDGHTEADVTRLLSLPAVDVVEVVRCTECKHRPTKPEKYIYGIDLEFPDEACPCYHADEPFSSWYPSDDWFCPRGERKGVGE